MLFRTGFVCLLFAAVAQAAEVPPQETVSRPAAIVAVNCAAGERIQPVIDASPSPVQVDITGICVENVLVRNKDVILRGTTKPSLDGIRSTIRTMPALIVQGPVIATITGLSFSNSAGLPVSIRGANATLTDCLFENNKGSGLQVNAGAFVTAMRLAFNANTGRSINVSDAQFFCTACDISGPNFAVQATRGAIVSLLDSAVDGPSGILAADGGTQADLDCATANETHVCAMNATTIAAQASGGAVITLFDAGDFSGQVTADDRATVNLIGARQIAQGGGANRADFGGAIVAAANLDAMPANQSRLLSTNALHFARVLVTDDTIVKGAIQCSNAGDAQLDATVIRLSGTIVSGCDHAK